jgi:hypothetical protein
MPQRSECYLIFQMASLSWRSTDIQFQKRFLFYSNSMINQILLYIATPMLIAGICLVAPIEKWIPNISRKTADRVVIGSIFCFVIVSSTMAILRLYSLSAKGLDMGVWEHHIYTMMKGTAPLSQYLHRPIYLLYIPFYAIGQMPLLLVLKQSS